MATYTYQIKSRKGWETIVIYSHPAQFSGRSAPARRNGPDGTAWRIVDGEGTVLDRHTPYIAPRPRPFYRKAA